MVLMMVMVMMTMVMTIMMIKMTMKVMGEREEPGGERRSEGDNRYSLVTVQGARVHRYPPWTFGELAHITFDLGHAARSSAALRFHALPVHVRKGLENERFA